MAWYFACSDGRRGDRVTLHTQVGLSVELAIAPRGDAVVVDLTGDRVPLPPDQTDALQTVGEGIALMPGWFVAADGQKWTLVR